MSNRQKNSVSKKSNEKKRELEWLLGGWRWPPPPRTKRLAGAGPAWMPGHALRPGPPLLWPTLWIAPASFLPFVTPPVSCSPLLDQLWD